MINVALTPKNDGDGVAGHPKPVPDVYIGCVYTAGRGGMLDYMTYNTRSSQILVDMAANLGWDADALAAARTKLHATWAYLGCFFGPSAEADPQSPGQDQPLGEPAAIRARVPRFRRRSLRGHPELGLAQELLRAVVPRTGHADADAVA